MVHSCYVQSFMLVCVGSGVKDLNVNIGRLKRRQKHADVSKRLEQSVVFLLLTIR
jgi:hypothetical protein